MNNLNNNLKKFITFSFSGGVIPHYMTSRYSAVFGPSPPVTSFPYSELRNALTHSYFQMFRGPKPDRGATGPIKS